MKLFFRLSLLACISSYAYAEKEYDLEEIFNTCENLKNIRPESLTANQKEFLTLFNDGFSYDSTDKKVTIKNSQTISYRCDTVDNDLMVYLLKHLRRDQYGLDLNHETKDDISVSLKTNTLTQDANDCTSCITFKAFLIEQQNLVALNDYERTQKEKLTILLQGTEKTGAQELLENSEQENSHN